MGSRESSAPRPDAATATSPTDLLQVARAELDRYHHRAATARAGLGGDWRSRLRATVYAFYRYLEEDERRRLLLVELRAAGERPALLIDAEVEALVELIDE